VYHLTPSKTQKKSVSFTLNINYIYQCIFNCLIPFILNNYVIAYLKQNQYCKSDRLVKTRKLSMKFPKYIDTIFIHYFYQIVYININTSFIDYVISITKKNQSRMEKSPTQHKILQWKKGKKKHHNYFINSLIIDNYHYRFPNWPNRLREITHIRETLGFKIEDVFIL
jgi:hypothetical protein